MVPGCFQWQIVAFVVETMSRFFNLRLVRDTEACPRSASFAVKLAEQYCAGYASKTVDRALLPPEACRPSRWRRNRHAPP